MIANILGIFLEVWPCFLITATPFLAGILLFHFFSLLFSPFWFLHVLYWVWYFFDRETPFRAGRRVPFIRKLSVWKKIAAYFPAKLHKTAELDPSKNFIFAVHPHGIPVFGSTINIGTNANGFDELFPGLTIHLLTVNLPYKFPFARELLIAAGMGSVNADSIDYKLTKMGPGHSVVIAVGGGAEAYVNSPDRYNIKLKTRKGFIRMALKTGASVVPVFIFNENRTYDIPPIVEGTFPYYVDTFIKLFTRDILPLNVHGRWWWAGLLVPKKVPLNTVIGAPVDFAKMKSFTPGQEPPSDLVDECHKFYLETYQKLYDDHKARFGDENTPIVFV